MLSSSAAQVRVDGRSLAVALSGDLASATDQALEAAPRFDADVVTVDLSEVTCVDGHGLDRLIELVERAAAAGAAIRYRRGISSR